MYELDMYWVNEKEKDDNDDDTCVCGGWCIFVSMNGRTVKTNLSD